MDKKEALCILLGDYDSQKVIVLKAFFVLYAEATGLLDTASEMEFGKVFLHSAYFGYLGRVACLMPTYLAMQ